MMYSRYFLRTTLGILLCLALASASFGQTSSSTCGNQTGQIPCVSSRTGAVILVITGVTAVVGLLYYFQHKPNKNQSLNQGSIVGCVQNGDSGLTLRNEKDQLTYGIIADNVSLKPSERVEVAGNKFKGSDGKLHMDVQTLVTDFGPCNP